MRVDQYKGEFDKVIEHVKTDIGALRTIAHSDMLRIWRSLWLYP